jgi:hypothetical protein
VRRTATLERSPNDIDGVLRGRNLTTQKELARWYCFSGSVKCELCSMIKAEISQEMLEYDHALIFFNGSPSILKGWIKSELAFSFSMHVANIENDDHDTMVSHQFREYLYYTYSIDYRLDCGLRILAQAHMHFPKFAMAIQF